MVVSRADLERARRSLAMADSLPADVVVEIIETCDQLMMERVQIERILSELRPAWRGARHALNELDRVLQRRRPERRR